MKQHDVLNFLSVTQRIGYALALVGTAGAAILLALGQLLPLARFAALSPGVIGWILVGLLLAWTAALSRRLVRRMRFETAQDTP